MPIWLIKIGVSILGGLKSLLKFLVDNWKIVVPILLVISAIWYHTNAIENATEQGYTTGVQAEKKAQAARVDEENARNRKFEQSLQRAVNNFGKSIINDTAERVVAEAELSKTVETYIREKPIYQTCKVDPEVLDARNKIRQLGPGPIVRVELNDEN